jgi:hypothetical protein
MKTLEKWRYSFTILGASINHYFRDLISYPADRQVSHVDKHRYTCQSVKSTLLPTDVLCSRRAKSNCAVTHQTFNLSPCCLTPVSLSSNYFSFIFYVLLSVSSWDFSCCVSECLNKLVLGLHALLLKPFKLRSTAWDTKLNTQYWIPIQEVLSVWEWKQSLVLSPGSTLLEKSRNSSPFIKPKGSLPYSQEPASDPHPEPHKSSPHPHIASLEHPR